MADLREIERRCIKQIREIQERHRLELEPLMNHLVKIRSLMPSSPAIIPQEMYDRLIAPSPPSKAEE